MRPVKLTTKVFGISEFVNLTFFSNSLNQRNFHFDRNSVNSDILIWSFTLWNILFNTLPALEDLGYLSAWIICLLLHTIACRLYPGEEWLLIWKGIYWPSLLYLTCSERIKLNCKCFQQFILFPDDLLFFSIFSAFRTIYSVSRDITFNLYLYADFYI